MLPGEQRTTRLARTSRTDALPRSFLPGHLFLCRGTRRDYDSLAAFHYLRGRPATFADVWTARYREPAARRSRLVAIGVLSWPVLNVPPRRHALRLRGSCKARLRFANRQVRTISHVIVHPQFRALGLSTRLVRLLCAHCPTRYVEASAAMAAAHPLFARAGMRRIDPPPHEERPTYFLLDRQRAPRRHH
jgi:hypothetical protein